MNTKEKEGRVVAVVTVQLFKRRHGSTFAARCQPLGLTAYGEYPDQAVAKMKRMYGAAVRAHRECGSLASWLNESELQWAWENEYKGDLPVERAEPHPKSYIQNDDEEALWSPITGPQAVAA